MRCLPSLFAVLCTLAVAYSCRSAAGLAFLLSFFVWGWKCLGACRQLPSGQQHAHRIRRTNCAGLWAFVSTASALLLAAQLFLQLLYTLHLAQPPSVPPPSVPGPETFWSWCWSWAILILLRPSQEQGRLLDILQLMGPPLVCLLASVSESQRCRDELEVALATQQEALEQEQQQQEGSNGGGDQGIGARESVVEDIAGRQAGGLQRSRAHSSTARMPSYGCNLSSLNSAATSTWPLMLPLSTCVDSEMLMMEGQQRQRHFGNQTAQHQHRDSEHVHAAPHLLSILRDVLVVCAALLWPSVASMAYIACVAWGVHAWSRARRNATVGFGVGVGGRLLQVYVALHILLLYAVQAPLLQATIPSILETLTNAAGLYGFAPPSRHGNSNLPLQDSTSASAHLPSYFHLRTDSHEATPEAADYWPQLGHQATLHVLYAVLGLCCSGLWQQPGMQGQVSSRVQSGLSTVLLYVANLVSGPTPVAVSLCCISMVEVSVAGACLLGLGIWTLLGPKRWGKDALAQASPSLTSLLLLWLLAIYTATSLQQYYDIVPKVFQSIGLFAFQSPPPVFLALAGQLAAVMVSARLARNTTRQRQGLFNSETLLASELNSYLMHAPSHWEELRGLWKQSSLTLVAATWYAGFWAAPASWLLVAVCRLDLLHAVYLGAIALHCLGACLWPTPRAPCASICTPRHRLIRVFASLHLLALYLAMCGQLPGLEILQRPELEALLKLIGIWDPSIHRDCLPVLSSLLVCTVHSVAGQWLARAGQDPLGAAAATGRVPQGQRPAPSRRSEQQQQIEQEQQQHQKARATNSPLLWRTGSALAAFASGFGSLFVATTAAACVLWLMPPGLLGAAYLILGAALVLCAPRSHDLVNMLVRRPSVATTGYEASCTGEVLELHRGGLLKQFLSAWRQGWGTVACFACLCLADMAVVYSAATAATTRPRGLPADISQLLQDVVGISLEQLKPGPAFVTAITRPVVLLLLLQTLRWCVMLDALLSWWRSHYQQASHPTGTLPLDHQHPNHNHQQQQQQLVGNWEPCGPGIVGLVQRAVVLHVDKLQAVLVLGAALQRPGSLGLLTTACLAGALPLLRGSQLGMQRASKQGGQHMPSCNWRAWAAKCVVTCLQLLLGSWMLAEYALQVPWVRMQLGLTPGGIPKAHSRSDSSYSSILDDSLHLQAGYVWSMQPAPTPILSPCARHVLLKLLEWMGLPLVQATPSKHDDSGAEGGMAILLGLKAALLAVAAVRQQAWSWAEKVPDEARAAAQPGCPCCLLWPQPHAPLHLQQQKRGLPRLRASRAQTDHGISSSAAAAAVAAAAIEQGRQPVQSPISGDEAADRAGLEADADRVLVDARNLGEVAGDEGQGHEGGASGGVPEPRQVSFVEPLRNTFSSVVSALGQGAASVMGEPEEQQGFHFEEVGMEDEGAVSDVQVEGGDWVDVDESQTGGGGQPLQPEPKHTEPVQTGDEFETPYCESQLPSAHQQTDVHVDPLPHQQQEPLERPTTSAATLPASPTASDSLPSDWKLPPQGGVQVQTLPTGAGAQPNGGQVLVLNNGQYVRLLMGALCRKAEGFWTGWGLDMCLLALLLAAFALCNALSLLCMVAVVFGSIAPYSSTRAQIWRWCVVPLLACMLVYEYASWTSFDQLSSVAHISCESDSPAGEFAITKKAQAHGALWWLGARGVATSALWMLLVALGACVMQVQSDAFTLFAPCQLHPQDYTQAPYPDSDSHPSGGSGWASMRLGWFGRSLGARSPSKEEGEGDLEAPLLAHDYPLFAQQQHQQPTGQQRAANGLNRNGKGGSWDDALIAALFAPLDFQSQPFWGWQDVARYLAIKHSIDLLLVCVVALCAMQRDLVHACYLALALLLFRKRTDIRQAAAAAGAKEQEQRADMSGNSQGATSRHQLKSFVPSSFWLLPAFNLAVMLLELGYQAPWHNVFGPRWDNSCRPLSDEGTPQSPGTCTLPELLGFCKLRTYSPPDNDGFGTGLNSTAVTQTTWWHWISASLGAHGRPGRLGDRGPDDTGNVLAALLASSAAADLVLWVLLRVHAKLLTTPVYRRVMWVVEQQHAMVVADLKALDARFTHQQAQEALTASQLRAARKRRIAKLKALFEPHRDQTPALDLHEGQAEAALKAASGQTLGDGGKPGPTGAGAGVGTRIRAGSDKGHTVAGSLKGASTVGGLAELLGEDEPAQAVQRVADAAADARQPQQGQEVQAQLGQGREQQQLQEQHAQCQATQKATSTSPGGSRGSVSTSSGGTNTGAGPSGVQAAGRGLVHRHARSARTPEGGRLSGGTRDVPVTSQKEREGAHHNEVPVAGQEESEDAQHRVCGSGVVEPVGAGAKGVLQGEGEIEAAAPTARPHHHQRHHHHQHTHQQQCKQLGSPLLRWLQRRPTKRVDTSWVVCAACVLLLVADLSLLSLVLPLFAFGFTLVSQRTPRAYWQAALVYAEALLIAQYSYLCLVRCMCEAPSAMNPQGEVSPGIWDQDGVGWCGGMLQDPRLRYTTAWVGLHEHVLRCIPTFIAYLSLLMYTYHLAQTSEMPKGLQQQGQRSHAVGFRTLGAHSMDGYRLQEGRLAAAVVALRHAVARAYATATWCIAHVCFQVYQAYRVAGQSHELSPHWVMVCIAWDPNQLPETGWHDQAAAGGQGVAASASPCSLAATDAPVQDLALRAEAALNQLLQVARLGGVGQEPLAHETSSALPSRGSSMLAGTLPQNRAAKNPPESHLSWLSYLRQDVLSHVAPMWLRLEHAAPHTTDGKQELMLLFEVIAPWGSSPPKRIPAHGTSNHEGHMQPGTPRRGVSWSSRGVGRGFWHEPELPSRGTGSEAGTGEQQQQQQSFQPGRSATVLLVPPGGEGATAVGGSESLEGGIPAPATPAAPSTAGQELGHALRASTTGGGTATGPAERSQPIELKPLLLRWFEGWAPRAARPAHAAACVINRAGESQQRGAAPPTQTAAAPSVQPDAAQLTQAAGVQPLSGSSSCSTEIGSGVVGCATAVDSMARQLPFHVLKAQRHSRRPRDYYNLTVLADTASFLYAAFTYRMVVSVALGGGAGASGDSGGDALSDLGDTSATVLPIDYVLALMVLFGLTVAERTVYTLGSSGAKMVLHWLSMALLLPWCLGLMWRLAANGAGVLAGGPSVPPAVTQAAQSAAQHLRVFLGLRCVSFALGALQLRDGYPPLSAHGAVPGRHDSLFYRKPDTVHFMFFQIYCAVPFLYELRTLLDWTCTATTLDWYNWLKLEDIRASLFVAASRRQMLKSRRPGQKVPRSSKVFQGAVILSLLLLVLWLPPLVFSSGAPTYTTPSIQSVQLNVTITQVGGSDDPYGNSEKVVSSTSPLFVGGPTFSLRSWGIAKGQPALHQPPSMHNDVGHDLGHGQLYGSGTAWTKREDWTSQHGDRRAHSQREQRGTAFVNGREGKKYGAADFGWSIAGNGPEEYGESGEGIKRDASVKPDDVVGRQSESGGMQRRKQQQQQPQKRQQLSSGQQTGRKKKSSPPPPAPSTAPPPPAPAPAPVPASGNNYVLPPYLSSYTPAQVKLLCLTEHSDTSWQSSPPAQAALAAILDVKDTPPGPGGKREGNEAKIPDVVMNFGWAVERSAPLASQRSGAGPLCSASASVRLSGRTRTELAALMRGERKAPVPITVLDPAYPNASLADQAGSSGLFPLFWRARGEVCSLRFGLDSSSGSEGGGAADAGSGGGASVWSREMVTCSMSLELSTGLQWWSLSCRPLLPDQPQQWQRPGYAGNSHTLADRNLPDQVTCPEGAQGPMAVVVLERVQSGLLGATLSSFGITGLYITFVYGIARLLRLSTSDLRLKIPTEDLPSTQRLVTLCQDIYIARAQGELVLEEELYAALISVYRSPAVLYELTRKHKCS